MIRSAGSIVATVGSAAFVLGVDVVLVLLGLRTISQTAYAWALDAPIVAIAGGSLMGHLFHDRWSLHLRPLPGHVAYFFCLVTLGVISQAMQDAGRSVPMIVLVNLGYVLAHATVPV